MFVDADSCPVKAEIVEIANEKEFETLFVASYAHMKNDLNNMKWKFVDSMKEAVDL